MTVETIETAAAAETAANEQNNQNIHIDMRDKEPLKTINRSAMARALGIDVAHVSRVLSGKRRPSLNTAMRMANYLRLTLDELFRMLSTKPQ